MSTKELVYSFFKNRTAVLATMHYKERVIGPILEDNLGIKVIVPANFNTDLFGTFTRDVARRGTQLEAARYKAEEAMLLTGATLAIASEGTFGPHPIVPYLPFNREIILLADKENDMEIVGMSVSTETNYGEKAVKSFDEAYQFALAAGFPEHGMIIRTKSDCPSKMIKGITTKEGLRQAFENVSAETGEAEVTVEADMRAMYNPTRMKNIEAAAKDLISKIYSICPACSFPGFTLKERRKGLPCSWCALPTELTLAEVYSCNKCGLSKEMLYPGGTEKADPGQCNYCNP